VGSAGAISETPTGRNAECQRRRFAPASERFWRRVDRRGPDECWPWLGSRLPNGYGITRLWGSERRYTIGAHRAAWVVSHGEIPAGMFVCHRCDNPPCCNPSHLFLGSPKDNLDDMYRKGRQRNLVGEQRAFAKLTQTQVLEIRARYASGEKQRDLASEFNVRQPRISKIVTRKAWRWL
jgi:HNH endonuclease